MEAMADRSQHPFELGIWEDDRANETDIWWNSDSTEYRSLDEGDDKPLVQDMRELLLFKARREQVRNQEASESEDGNVELPMMPDMRNVVQQREGEEGGPCRATLQPRRRPYGTTGRDTGRHSLGPFLNARKDAIRANHAAVLTALMNLLSAHQDGITGGLGRGNQINFLCGSLPLWFSNNGPLFKFRPITAGCMRGRFKEVEGLAKQMHIRNHSNGQTGVQ